MTNPEHVLVLGGGITGMIAAYRLRRRPTPPRVTLVEAGDRLGGKLRTERIDGFVLDLGPEALAPGKPHAAKLAQELGIEMVPARRGAPGAVLIDGRLRTMPEGIGGFIPRRVTPLATTRLFTVTGKGRMALEALIPARRDEGDESLESFTSRRLGREAYRRMVEPVASGIFGGDPATTSLLATMPHLRAAERTHGSLVRAVLAERRAAPKKASRPGIMSPSGGMAAIVEAVAQHLTADPDVDVLLHTRATLTPDDAGRVRARLTGAPELTADAVVLALPAPEAARCLRDLGADRAADLLGAMTVASTTTVNLGYRAAGLPDLDAALPAHGYLVAGPVRGAVRSVTRSSAKFPGRAPADHELFRVTVRTDDLPPGAAGDAEAVRLARAELLRTLHVTAEPVLTHVQHWVRVVPQYAVGHLDRVRELEQSLHPQAVVAGSGVHGLGIADCVASAERAVERLFPA